MYYQLYAPMSSDLSLGSAEILEPHETRPARHWTLLVLAPNGFFNEHSILFPSTTAEIGPNVSQTTIDPLGKLTLPGAELKFIGQGLEKISERWSDFQAYFDYMLDSGNSLMQPSEHDNLLFDDGAFSRSRRYFWAIDCLNEFETSITDNLNQWEQYRLARIDPILHFLPQVDRRLLYHVERQCRILQNQRDTFRQKLGSIKALRDAVSKVLLWFMSHTNLTYSSSMPALSSKVGRLPDWVRTSNCLHLLAYSSFLFLSQRYVLQT